ncbi:hypothetical protein [Gloeothece verrucosa]|uniref:Uncharacterized protein n=1 Tax=Gloeothece verrucosa (strain PCC 7822) TaxID=497965 RepID=E0UMV4_GLOV7|nr:hypothetical protein [Gloeothece verrucosa]ADN18284.1 hypothetical protein Cyan7822_6510 [Gloeothece verrucosa PCC 7822]
MYNVIVAYCKSKKMKEEARKKVAELIELINRATPDSLKIAQAILKKNPLIQIPQLPLLKNYVKSRLRDKTREHPIESTLTILWSPKPLPIVTKELCTYKNGMLPKKKGQERDQVCVSMYSRQYLIFPSSNSKIIASVASCFFPVFLSAKSYNYDIIIFFVHWLLKKFTELIRFNYYGGFFRLILE